MRPSIQGGSALLVLLMFFNGCQGSGAMQPITTVTNLDLNRFMGTWYVLADIATPFDKDAYAPTEHYALADNGRVETTYQYRKGGPQGEIKSKTMSARPHAETPAIWGMRILWPFEADYRVAYLDPDYRYTVVARNKRDFVWIMARDQDLEDALVIDILRKVEGLGYDLTKLRFHHGLEDFTLSKDGGVITGAGPDLRASESEVIEQSTPRFGT